MHSTSFLRSIVFAARATVVLVLALACRPTWAIDLTLTEQGDHLAAVLTATPAPADQALAKRYGDDASVLSPTAEAGKFTVALDSTARIGGYLKAARLSGGLYVHLPHLCPDGDCSGVRFTIQARHILFGDVLAQDSLTVEGRQAEDASVFFTNELEPSLRNGLYIGPEFPQASARALTRGVDAIGQAYRALSGRDLREHVGIIATTAVNNGGYTGFGGDALNIIRLTFDNPNGQSPDQMVQTFLATLAHEFAHKLQSPRLHELANGRLIAEGSADFLKAVILLRSGVGAPDQVHALVTHAYDECLRQRGPKTLDERIADHSVDYREHYDCGMVDYLALDFLRAGTEEAFLAELLAVLQDPVAPGGSASRDCLLLRPSCDQAVIRDLMGHREPLASRRAWFDGQWALYRRMSDEPQARFMSRASSTR